MYGDLPVGAPHKPNKGQEGGACNRERCQAEPALWFNHGMYKWYCGDCAIDIGDDHVNKMGWVLSDYYPGHPQFETREMINAREEARTPDLIIIDEIPPMLEPELRSIPRPQQKMGAHPNRRGRSPGKVEMDVPLPSSRQQRRQLARQEAKRRKS